MTKRPSDRELDRLLAGLPRTSAPQGFSRRVLDDLDDRPRPRTRRGFLLAAAGAAAALAIGLWLLPPSEPDPTLAETLALEEEHRQLVAELEALKASLADSQAPILYLGGNESVDLVLDLRPVWQGETAAVPAAYRGPPRPQPAADRRTGERR